MRSPAPRSLALTAALLALSCGVSPQRAPQPARPLEPASRRRPPDPCEEDETPLRRSYAGVAARARCDREVFAIMGGVTRALGVDCWYCHIKGDYEAMTDRQRIANWMASSLIPALRAKSGKRIWCEDCHVLEGIGTARILGYPRERSRAMEWMTSKLVERFDDRNGAPLFCPDCHMGTVGTPDFEARVIGTEHLPGSESGIR